MKQFISEDNICAQNLLKLVSHGNAIIAEILRLKDYIPYPFRLDTKEQQQKYQDVILDFVYFKTSDVQDKKIASNVKLQELDDDLKEQYLELITRFYLLFLNIHQYVGDLNSFLEQINDGVFIQQNIDTILKDVEGKQLLCESLYLYGAMLLICDLYIPGPLRERLLVAFYRYSTIQSQSNVDEVCRLLRDTGYNQQLRKKPAEYPVEYFGRININEVFIEKVIDKLRSEDIYNQLPVYTAPEHRSAALATQAGMLFVCMFFSPQNLKSESHMREIVDKFFPNNWIVSVYMGITLNIIDYWDGFKAAKNALSNTCNSKLVKEVSAKRGATVPNLISKIHQILNGEFTDEYLLDNVNKMLNLLINCNLVIRWLLLHSSDVVFFDNNKKSKQLRDLIQKESNYNQQQLLELLISTSELETKVREILNRLLSDKENIWKKNKDLALDGINSLSELFSGSNLSKIPENKQLKSWFENIGNQITSLSESITTKSVKKITQLIQALDEVEEFHEIKNKSAVVQFLTESKQALKSALRIASLKEEYLITLETVADVSYGWCIIDSYTQIMQNSIKENPSVTSRLRALFLKLASAMEIPLLRINQARSEDLISVSQYYSNELIKYIQKVLQIIPEMVFKIVKEIIELQTWEIKEIPTRLDRDKLGEYALLDKRLEVAKLTHSASMFTTGILDMRSTLVGVIRVDPAELLEEGLLKELSKHFIKIFEELLEPAVKKTTVSPNSLPTRLQKLAENMDGYKRSLEYIQDYINIHGLRIWQKQVSLIISESVDKEISLRKGVDVYSPSAGFMGSLARQLLLLVDARTCAYIKINAAWFDLKTHNETVNTKTFTKLEDAVGVVGLHALDTLFGFMIKNQLLNAELLLKQNKEKLVLGNIMAEEINQVYKEIDQTIVKNAKVLQQISDVLTMIGTLQLLRKHISHHLNTSCKFESAFLESSLHAVNESLLNELKAERKISTELLHTLEEYLTRCGINNPFEKMYLKNMQSYSDLTNTLVLILLSQLPKLQLSLTTGDLISRKAGENIDGCPILVGIYTVLCQTNLPVEHFIESLCTLVKGVVTLKLSSSFDSTIEPNVILRILELFTELFEYPFSKLQDKLPMGLLVR